MWARLIEVYALDNYPLLLSSAVTFFLGFWQYTLSFKQIVTKDVSPLPYWIHSFYLAHDSSFAVRCLIAASQNNWHWFLTGTSVALFIWTGLEIVSIHNAITRPTHRQEIWGLNGAPVTQRAALWSAAKELAMFYAVVNFVFERFASDAPMFDWFVLTNVVLAWGPSLLWRQRTTSEGNNLLYIFTILLTTLHTFAPWNMWALAFPDLYRGFWFNAMGAATLIVNISNMKHVAGLPVKAGNEAKQK